MLRAHPLVQRGHVGFSFVDVETGKVLAQHDSSRLFTPASNTKLYTTAMALVRLGPNYRFRTELRTRKSWVPGQTALQELELVGGGDPNLSNRTLPYSVNEESSASPRIPALEALAEELVQSGIREVDGNVTGVATRYSGDLYPNGWTIDDSLYGYGAPVTALAVDDNTITITLHPTSVGEVAALEAHPAAAHMIVLDKVVTRAPKETTIHMTRRPGTSEIVLWGAIGRSSPDWRAEVALDNPALFAADALIGILRNRGVVIRGEARSEYRDLTELAPATPLNRTSAAETVLAVYDSAPLFQVLQVVNKVSQNLHAEMLLREVAHVTSGVGTLQAGVNERQAFLDSIGITPNGTGFALADGSGLARQDLTTPDSTVALLRYMWQRPDRDLWLATLPVGGVDGTLQHRFQNIAGAERIHAKTGSLSHVNALSGYLETRHHRWLVFSIMVNGTSEHNSDVHDFIDQLCAAFLDD